MVVCDNYLIHVLCRIVFDSAGDVVRCHRVGRKHFLDHIVVRTLFHIGDLVKRHSGLAAGSGISLGLVHTARLHGCKCFIRVFDK